MSARAFTFSRSTVGTLIAHYARLQGLDGWDISHEFVAGLKHHGEDAWAVVETDPAARTIHIRVRDLAATPLDAADPWHELKVTISHELWHPWLTWVLEDPSVDREEALVEAAAQAVVRAGGADARVMARSIQAIPAAVRARVATVRANMVSGHGTAHDPHSGKFTSGSGGGGGGGGAAPKTGARAVTRARGGTMDPEKIKALIAAIKEQNGEAALKIAEDLLVEAASGGAAGHVEPDGDETMMDDDLNPPIEAREDNGGGMQDPNKPGGPPAARPMARDDKPEDENARRARKAADSLNRSAIRARVHEARVVDGITLAPELERMILAETDIDAAEKLLKVAKIARGDGAPARARGADTRPAGTPPPANEAKPKYTEAELVKEGIHPTLAKQIAAETDHRVADLTLGAARARIAAANGSPWASKPNGGAS